MADRLAAYRAALNAPLDDEPVTAEDAEAIAQALGDIEAGRTVPHEEVLREFGLPGEVAPDELEALLLEGLASKELTEAEFWDSVNRETDALFIKYSRRNRPA